MTSSEEDFDAIISNYISSESESVEQLMTSSNEDDEYDTSDALFRAVSKKMRRAIV